MSLKPTNEQRDQLIRALAGAYLRAEDFANALWLKTGTNLQDYLNFNQGKVITLGDAVRLAEGQGWLEQLVRASAAGAPLSQPLADVMASLGLAPLPPPPAEPPRLLAATEGALEEIIRKRRPPVLTQLFAERLQAISRAVCWIGIKNGSQFGSGFLVAPDLVLTNHHVIGRILRNEVEPGAVICRFDHLSVDGADGPGEGLAGHWPPLDLSPPAGSDVRTDGKAPTADELDYALIRLDAAMPGDRVPLKIAAEPPPLLTDDFVFVVQHPAVTNDAEEGAQRIAPGIVLGFEADGLRVRYDTGTTPGSSGSPVFTVDLQLAALHQGTEPLRDMAGNRLARERTYNRGIPLRPIIKRMQARGVPRFW